MLVLEIEFLTGLCRAARGPAETAPDWPPQPDRVFSALVAAWGARGEDAAERAALEWLEAQDPPRLVHGDAAGRTAPAVFVPPNDFSSPVNGLQSYGWFRRFGAGLPPANDGEKKALRKARGVLPDYRSRAERRFPAASPHELEGDAARDLPGPAHLLMVWDEDPPPYALSALDGLACDVSYLGHSTSLARCRFRLATAVPAGAPARRRIYPGRLAELRRNFAEKLGKRGEPRRPAPGEAARSAAPGHADAARAGSCFSPDWLVLEIVEGEAPDLRAAARVARTLRDALMSGYGRIGEAPPEAVSGHAPDGAPTAAPHLAVAPLAFAGWPHADGRLLGFALIPPAAAEDDTLLHGESFARAFQAVSAYDKERERRVLTLREKNLRGALALAPAGGAPRKSLRPAAYVEAARVWATVTPIALDRHLKKSGAARDAEARGLVAEACERIGLPRPDPDRIRIDKHSAIEGAPSVRVGGGPHWTRWAPPPFLKSRTLAHAVIDFGEPARGPVILGAGRFAGLGLCRGIA
jgi:CRISPR-associated protein Csb2